MLTHKVDAILQSVTSLRPMPGNVTRILRELDRPNLSIDMLVGLISLDQALTAMVLQMSNSAGLGYARKCGTLNEAIMYIGLGRLKTILMTSSATSMLKRRLSGYRLGAGELWHHSLVTSVAAEWLAQALRYPNPEEAYISGLLHDLGKLLLDQFVLSNYDTIVDYVQRYRLPLWAVEEKLLGFDHARVGGMVAERWNFPGTLVDAIRYHHTPSFARQNQQLPAIINLANAFSADYLLQKSALLSFEIHPEALNLLKLDAARVEKLRAGLKASGRFPENTRNGANL